MQSFMIECIILSSTGWVFQAPNPDNDDDDDDDNDNDDDDDNNNDHDDNDDDGTPLDVPPVEWRDNIDTWHPSALLGMTNI